MRIIILGAGASTDTVNPAITEIKKVYAGDPLNNVQLKHQSWAPPLGDKLFSDKYSEIMAHYPSVNAISGTVSGRMLRDGLSLEECLELMLMEADKSRDRKCDIANIKYYLQHLLLVCSDAAHQHGMNYAKLIDALNVSGEEVCIITFNYDTLLEHCMTEVTRHTISDMISYTSHQKIKIIKVHGSCNWHRYVEDVIPDNVANPENDAMRMVNKFPEAALSDFSGNLGSFHVHSQLSRGMRVNSKSTLLVPALALPVAARKNKFECPDDHLRTMRECLQKADKVLSIGWKGAEHLFMAELEKHLPVAVEWTVVSNSEEGCAATLKNIKENLTTSNDGKLLARGDKFIEKTMGFSNYIDSKDFQEFLNNAEPQEQPVLHQATEAA